MKNLICPFAASRLMLIANPSLALPFTLATVIPKTVSFTPAVKSACFEVAGDLSECQFLEGYISGGMVTVYLDQPESPIQWDI
jgi:hypothetical protein